MLDWLNTNIEYWHWIVFGLILVTGEIVLTSFILLWFGISAILVGIFLLLFPFSFTIQLLSWVILSLIVIFGWFKWISPLIKTKSLSGMARETLLGKVGTVIEINSMQTGRGILRFPAPIVGNDEWQFICEDLIEVGNRVSVREISGNTLIVQKHGSNLNTSNQPGV